MNFQHTKGQIEITMFEKGRIQRYKFAKGHGDKANAEENGQLCLYITTLYIFVMVTTHRRFRTEVYNIKQEPEVKPTKANQNKENRNTRTRKHRNTELPESKR